jgi:hypothetical protein
MLHLRPVDEMSFVASHIGSNRGRNVHIDRAAAFMLKYRSQPQRQYLADAFIALILTPGEDSVATKDVAEMLSRLDHQGSKSGQNMQTQLKVSL